MKKIGMRYLKLGNIFCYFAKALAMLFMVALIGCTSSSTDDSDDNTPPQEQPSDPDNGDDSSNENEDFTDENIGQHVQEISSVIEPLFKECNNIEELSSYIEDIKVIEGVSEVWTTNNALYVNTKSGAKLAWLFTPDDNQEQTEYEEYTSESINPILTRSSEQNHEYIAGSDKMDVCIINQQANDESRNWFKTHYNKLGNSFPSDTFNVTYIDGYEANIHFFKNVFTEYDIVFFITHGGYDGKKHWIMSGTEIDSSNKLLVDSFYKTVKGDDVSIHSVKETRDEETTIVSYVTFSEDFIKTSIKGNFDNSIIFCTACQSLKNNSKIANAFKARGAKAYLGYNETNSVGKLAGARFFNALIRGYTIHQAYINMPEDDRVDPDYSAQLISAIPDAENICIVHPKVKTIEKPEVEGASATLEGVIEEWNGNKLLEGEVGFCWSKSEDCKEPTIENDFTDVLDISNSYQDEIEFNTTIEGLEPTTEYTYRTYLLINDEYFYGEVKSFTTEDDPEAYMKAYLVRLYNDTNGDNWKYNDGWCSNKPLDEWHGVSSYQLNGKRIYEIDLSYNNLRGTINLGGCTALAKLDCTENQILDIDVYGCTELNELYCKSNQLMSLNVSGRKKLEYLDCRNNQLISLNVARCTALKSLSCDHNFLSDLDVSELKALEYLYCTYNILLNLNISGCTSLTEFGCHDNQLTNIDVSSCTELIKFNCYSNPLTSLNILGCTALSHLPILPESLINLNIVNCTSLSFLKIEYDQLVNLQVIGCSSLTLISCHTNQLESLNISGCASLKELDCHDNQLTNLNISGCPSLTKLDCHDNQLTSLEVSSCTALEILDCHDNKITDQITKQLYDISFICDWLYNYDLWYDNEGFEHHEWTKNEYGWYFPGEPSERGHEPPAGW